jgi:class 3 adenylate cyclase/tetratricopeptide (TPR) repeat protein
MQDHWPSIEDWTDAALPPTRLRVILVCDMVESVRWMQSQEQTIVQVWLQFLQRARTLVLPASQGSVIKSTGDGLMVEFATAHLAVQAAQALHEHAQDLAPLARVPLRLRVGIHEAQAHRDAHDLYGHGVNVVARIASIAEPGETLVSATVREHLVDGLDCSITALGPRYFKHVEEPVSVYRIGRAGEPLSPPPGDGSAVRSTIMVTPFEARSAAPQSLAIGELIAESIIGQLGASEQLRVISRLSSSQLQGRAPDTASLKALGCDYLCAGSFVELNGQLLVHTELSRASDSEVCFSHRQKVPLADLLEVDSQLAQTIAAGVREAIANTEAKRSLVQPLPSLASYSLLLGGIRLMHRTSMQEFERSGEALAALSQRHQRNGQVHAWLGKWHVLKVVRGISSAPQRDTHLALDEARRAQDLEPNSAQALAIHGHALTHLGDDPQQALASLNAALALNPNESLAWLYKSVWSSMWGQVDDAVHEAEEARRLSPVDPLGYYYRMIHAGACAWAGRYEHAIGLAQASLASNPHHAPTLRTLMFAQYMHGQIDDAKKTLAALLQETPGLTVDGYLAMGGAKSRSRQDVARVFRALGLAER